MYEMQLASIKRPEVVCSVEAALNHLDEKGANEHNQGVMEYVGYSRFIIYLIDKRGSTIVTPRANIPVADIFYIKEMKDNALNHKLLFEMNGSASEGGATVKFSGQTVPFGANRGKTIPELAAEGDRGTLEKLREFLSKNAEKYQVNRMLVADIDKALQLIDEGKESLFSTESKKTISIYEQNYKYLKTQRDEADRVFVYSILITCDLTKENPWLLEISNGYAPLEANAKGLYTPKASAMVGLVKSEIRMNSIEFCGLIDKMFYAARDYDNNVFMGQYKLAQALDEKARKERRAKKEAKAE